MYEIAQRISNNDFLPINRQVILQSLRGNGTSYYPNLSDSSETLNSSKERIDGSSQLEILIDRGIIVERSHDQFSFSNPLLLCCSLLTGLGLPHNYDAKFCLLNPLDDYLLKKDHLEVNYLELWLNEDWNSSNFPAIVNAIRHILHKINLDTRKYFEKLVSFLNTSNIPFSFKWKTLSALLFLDLDIRKILDILSKQISDKQLLNRFIAISLPALPRALCNTAFPQVAGSQDPVTQAIAAQYLLTIPGLIANSSISQLCNSLKEPFPAIVTELLALQETPDKGIFEELSISASITVRKSVVHGLRFCNQIWANEMLEKILSEDDQWIVRDTASHALESPWTKEYIFPQKRDEPNTSSWILQQASNRGIGIPAIQYPEALILDILANGSNEEKRVAIGYLEDYPTEKALSTLTGLSQMPNSLQEAAYLVLKRLRSRRNFIDLSFPE
jgi:hypothetical protein